MRSELTNDSPTISCIVPVHNAETYLRESIESVLAQTHPVDEIIVIDDGSTDNTPVIIRELGNKIISIRQKNAGPAVARNRGIRKARGKWIGFQDADDLWHPDKISRQVNILLTYPDIDIVATQIRNFWIPELMEEANRMKGHNLSQPQPGFGFPCLLIRKQVFDRIGMINEELRLFEDTDWLSRARDDGVGIYVLDEVLVRRRIHFTNTSRVCSEQENKERALDVVMNSLRRKRAVAKKA